MVDWFYNIGSYIDSYSYQGNAVIAGTYCTISEKTTREWVLTDMTLNHLPLANESYVVNPNVLKTETSRTRRYSNPAKPLLPRFNANWNQLGLKIADVVTIFGGHAVDFKRWKI